MHSWLPWRWTQPRKACAYTASSPISARHCRSLPRQCDPRSTWPNSRIVCCGWPNIAWSCAIRRCWRWSWTTRRTRTCRTDTLSSWTPKATSSCKRWMAWSWCLIKASLCCEGSLSHISAFSGYCHSSPEQCYMKHSTLSRRTTLCPMKTSVTGNAIWLRAPRTALRRAPLRTTSR